MPDTAPQPGNILPVANNTISFVQEKFQQLKKGYVIHETKFAANHYGNHIILGKINMTLEKCQIILKRKNHFPLNYIHFLIKIEQVHNLPETIDSR